MDRPLALIIGGSVGGLFAANLLRGIGWDVRVFERAREDLAGRGAGIGTREELFAVMRRIGIRLDATMGVAVRSRLCLDRSGNITHEVKLPSVNSAWDRIYRPLKAALPPQCLTTGASLERVEPDARSVTAIFADGSRASGDLLIGADGLHSTVRRQFLPATQPRYAGYVAWRGVIEESDIAPDIHAALFHHIAFCLPEGELVLSLPMPGRGEDTRPGRRRYHFVWYRPVDYQTELPLLCTDAEGRRHGTAIPPPLIRAEVIGELRAAARALLAPQIAGFVAATPQLLLQPIYDLESPRIAFARVALVGDAAFVARPHVATGVTKAALDAQCLADALAACAGDLTAALMRYDSERRRFGSALVARARHLGASLATAGMSEPERRVAAFQRRPEIILHEYGAAGTIA